MYGFLDVFASKLSCMPNNLGIYDMDVYRNVYG